MPGAININNKTLDSINIRIAVIESTLQVSGHVCTVSPYMRRKEIIIHYLEEL